MEKRDVDQAVQKAWLALVPSWRAWRSGASDALGLMDAVRGMDARTLRLLEGAHRGEEDVTPETRTVATRVHQWCTHADDVDVLCGDWARAMTQWDGRALRCVDALNVAITDGQQARAVAAWKVGRAPLLDLVDRVGELTRAFHGVVAGPSVADEAQAFLKDTADLFEDAQQYALRRHMSIKDGPQTLLDARAVESRWMAELIPTAASRHLARDAVSGIPTVMGQLKRVSVGRRAFLPGFVDLAVDGTPRVGWVEERGVAALLELVELTVRACSHALGADDESARLLGLATELGLITPPTLRRALRLERGDADAARRHSGFILLRQARVAAAFAADNPAHPRDARDSLARATGRDPDVLWACAWMFPCAEPLPLSPGIFGMEHARRFQIWNRAARTAQACLQQWDEDFSLRPAFHQAWAEALKEGGAQDTVKLMGMLGGRDDDKTALSRWFMEALG